MITDLLDLDLLRTFVLAADLDSFAKAAEQVSRSQSAISLQTQRLEELTGKQLFKKQGRGWQLTASGDLLLGYARQMLEINNQAVRALSDTAIAGQVRLGMLTDFSQGGLSQILSRFAGANPLASGNGLPSLPDITIFMLTHRQSPSPAVKRLIGVLQETLNEQLALIRKRPGK